MATTYTETLGMMQSLTGFMEDPNIQQELLGKGYDVASQIAKVQDAADALVARNTEQEQLKSSLREKTEEVVAAQEAAYKTASGMIDALAGMLGKTTETGKRVLEIRSRIRQRSDSGSLST